MYSNWKDSPVLKGQWEDTSKGKWRRCWMGNKIVDGI